MSTPLHRFFDCVEHRPNDRALTFIDRESRVHQLSFADLAIEAGRAAAGFEEQRIARGDVVPILLPTTPACLGAYLAALATGIVPVFLPPPRGQGGSAIRDQLSRLMNETGARRLLVDDVGAAVLGSEFADRLVLVARFRAGLARAIRPTSCPQDVAHLQATSGTTGRPRLAIIRHSNIAANTHAIGTAILQAPDDRVVSWLPLFHDMGLICLSCVWDWQIPLVLTDPTNFVRHPINGWLRLISEHGGTISPAPTAAYQACVRIAERRPPSGLDLRQWRVGFCGAEPVPANVLKDFHVTFSPFGLPAGSILPVYGLAEATLAVTIPAPSSQPVLDRVDVKALERGQAVRTADGPHARTFVALGTPLPGLSLRVVSPDGRACPDREVGEIQVRGECVIDGYWPGNEPADSLLTPDGYLHTGDLGYMASGQLHVVGRSKDIIILAGRNLAPSAIEDDVVRELEPDLTVSVAAVGVSSSELASERLVLVLESREKPASIVAVESRIRAVVQSAHGVSVAEIVWVSKGQLPRTTSGKLRRHLCRDLARTLAPPPSSRSPEGVELVAEGL